MMTTVRQNWPWFKLTNIILGFVDACLNRNPLFNYNTNLIKPIIKNNQHKSYVLNSDFLAFEKNKYLNL
jgi:hypothetical protein